MEKLTYDELNWLMHQIEICYEPSGYLKLLECGINNGLIDFETLKEGFNHYATISVEVLQILIKNGFDINATLQYAHGRYSTILIEAVKCEKVDLIEWLIENGADTEAKDFKGNTAKYYAENLSWYLTFGEDFEKYKNMKI